MTSKNAASYTWVKDLSRPSTEELFSRARDIKNKVKSGKKVETLDRRQVALLFNEPSTRTKLSFQMAAQRLGAQCLIIDDFSTSSMVKGETFLDTLWTLHSLGPDLLVVRCGGEEPLESWVNQINLPVINGGWGSKSHPTQALLDVFTLYERFTTLEGLKVVFVGDIDHSRVAASSLELLQTFGATVKVCAPASFCQTAPAGVERIPTLTEALKWCDVFFGLRVQKERHQGGEVAQTALGEFREYYSLSSQGLLNLSKDSVILHPGPINWGVEFQLEVERDPRFLVREQVENGVFVRAALMEKFLTREP